MSKLTLVAAVAALSAAILTPGLAEARHRHYRYVNPLPYPISYLHQVNLEHAQLVDALRNHDSRSAAEISRNHVLTLHKTMYVGLRQPT